LVWHHIYDFTNDPVFIRRHKEFIWFSGFESILTIFLTHTFSDPKSRPLIFNSTISYRDKKKEIFNLCLMIFREMTYTQITFSRILSANDNLIHSLFLSLNEDILFENTLSLLEEIMIHRGPYAMGDIPNFQKTIEHFSDYQLSFFSRVVITLVADPEDYRIFKPRSQNFFNPPVPPLPIFDLDTNRPIDTSLPQSKRPPIQLRSSLLDKMYLRRICSASSIADANQLFITEVHSLLERYLHILSKSLVPNYIKWSFHIRSHSPDDLLNLILNDTIERDANSPDTLTLPDPSSPNFLSEGLVMTSNFAAILFVIWTLMTGNVKCMVQKRLSRCGLMDCLDVIFRAFEWKVIYYFFFPFNF
jgi:hypothetical protein